MKKIIAIISIFAVMLAFAACGTKDNAATTAPLVTNAQGDSSTKENVIPTKKPDLPGGYSSLGNKEDYLYGFYFETVNKAGETNKQKVYTNETNLADALNNYGVITLNVDKTVKSVWGEEHNYEKTGYAWLVYADGELVEGGLDKVAIKNGANYLFRVETF